MAVPAIGSGLPPAAHERHGWPGDHVARRLIGTAIACLSTGVTIVLHLALEDRISGQASLLLFTLPIVLAGTYGGLWPGLLATVLSALASSWFLLEPIGSFVIGERADQVGLLLFGGVGVCISVVSGCMHGALVRARAAVKARRKSEAALRALNLDLERRVEERTHALAQEVTERRAAEEQIRRLNAALEGRVAERSADLERLLEERDHLLESERAARAEAERASHLKDEFLTTLSHELRTPLNAILGWTQLLRRPNPAPGYLNKGLEVLERNAKLQAQLISDLLDVSRIMSGKLHLDTQIVDMRGVIDAALDSVRPAARAKDITLRAALDGADAPVLGDSIRLQQVVWNLLSNAVKFTPRGGRVEVTLAASSEQMILSVRDTGQGIDPEFVHHLFERFRQEDPSATRQHGGLGLGLSIVRHLVELHGGVVRAESEGQGKGATFTVELPVQTGARVQRVGAEPAHRGTSLQGVRVLVVDDEPDARDLARRVLEERGADVVAAGSAPEALAAVRVHRPDVLVSDLRMPGMDGYTLIRQIRSASDAEDLPAVALTSFARPEDRQRAAQAGYQTHVAKPLEPGELVTAVARLSHRRWQGAPALRRAG